MAYNGAILIQGPSSHVKEQKAAWKNYKLIWSTWENEKEKYNDDDVVVLNKVPSNAGTGNIALQQKTVLEGVLKAKELGFNRVFKWRSDMIPTNPDMLIDSLNENKTNFFFYHVANGGYYVDYFMEGNVDDIYSIWEFDYLRPPFAEKALSINIRYKKLNENIVFIGRKITKENDIVWLKKGLNLSSPLYQKNDSGFITEELIYD